MATIIRGDADDAVQALRAALDAYESAHPGAVASLYRQAGGSVRLRVVDQRFAPMPKPRRHMDVWGFIEARAPEAALAEATLVLTVAPTELGTSAANAAFEAA
jgi:hypothetical protein